MSSLRGVHRLALGGGAGAGATARGRLPLLPPSCLAALRSRFSSAYPTTAGTTTSRQTPAADPRAETRPASARVRYAPRLMFGGIGDAPGRETHPDCIELARFAVAEHNSKTNAALEFVRLVKVRTQLVAGRMYYFTIEVREVDGGANKLYKAEAKVWLRSWENFKGLEEFVLVRRRRENEGLTGSHSC